VFRVAYTQGNESRVSHASLWTSMYPSVHNMISDKAKLKPEFVTLAEAVKPSDRYTVGVMGNGYIDAFWGFGDGWDAFKNNLHSGGGLKADDLFATAKKLLDAQPIKGGRPFFLYIGTIDAHVSWRAHEPWLAKYDPEPYTGPFVKACLDPQLDNIVAGKLKITERDKTRIIALYDADVSYNDAVLGKLLADLKQRGHADDTMLILTSDHGEEFWDHGRIGHGQSLREELIHVPFLVHYPPYFPPGRVVEEGIDVLDVMPTIADALGVAIPEGAQGESLLPLAQGLVAGYPRPSIGSQYELAHTMRLERYKLWAGGSGDVHLFDAAADPHEDHDLAASRPVERRALTDALGTFLAFKNQWKKRRWGVASNLLPGFAADLDK
jgi:arylsulfatase A-like enzyme